MYKQLDIVLLSLDITYEIIFIDDGSQDKTLSIIKNLQNQNENIRIISFYRNFGKSAALTCGFANAKGDIIITMDGDLQDDPKEIPRFIEALKEYDMVSGWKYKRHDPVTKTFPSKIFNYLTGKLTGVNIHDFNCGYKAYRGYVVNDINLYGELYRYIPVIAYWKGYRIGEIKVEHHPRIHGKSKYGIKRIMKGFLDLVTVKFLMAYKQRPLHLLGSIGLFLSAIGTAICGYLSYKWLMGNSIGERPLLMLGILLVIIGVQFIAMGLICELIISTQQNKHWVIRKD